MDFCLLLSEMMRAMIGYSRWNCSVSPSSLEIVATFEGSLELALLADSCRFLIDLRPVFVDVCLSFVDTIVITFSVLLESILIRKLHSFLLSLALDVLFLDLLSLCLELSLVFKGVKLLFDLLRCLGLMRMEHNIAPAEAFLNLD